MTTMKTIAAVTTLIALAAIPGFAQSDLRIHIPFAFTTPAGGHLPAGYYSVHAMSSTSPTPQYRFLNLATNRSALAFAPDTLERHSNLRAEVVFLCAAGSCAVSGIYEGGAKRGYGIHTSVKRPVPATDIAEIRIPAGD